MGAALPVEGQALWRRCTRRGSWIPCSLPTYILAHSAACPLTYLVSYTRRGSWIPCSLPTYLLAYSAACSLTYLLKVHTAWLVDPVQLAGEGAEDDDEEISLLEMLATDPVAESALGDKPVQALAATSDSLVAATRTTVSVWALEDGGVFARPARLSTGFRYPVTALAASSECIYAGCADGKVHVLQRAEG